MGWVGRRENLYEKSTNGMSSFKIASSAAAASVVPQTRDSSESFATGASPSGEVSEVASLSGGAVARNSHVPSGIDLWMRDMGRAAAEKSYFAQFAVAWNGRPLTEKAFTREFNTHFGSCNSYTRFTPPRGRKIPRSLTKPIGLAYRNLYVDFGKFLKKSLTIDIYRNTTVPWWMTDEEVGDQEDLSGGMDLSYADQHGVSVEEMLRVVNAMASRDRTYVVEWLYGHIKHEYKVGAEAYAAEVAAEVAAAERAAMEAMEAKTAPIRAKKALKAAEAALVSATTALMAALPVPLDTLRAAIRAAKAELGEEEVLDVRTVIVGLMPAPAVPDEADEDDWEADADALEAPDVVAPIVERYAAYVAAKTALKAAKAALK